MPKMVRGEWSRIILHGKVDDDSRTSTDKLDRHLKRSMLELLDLACELVEELRDVTRLHQVLERQPGSLASTLGLGVLARDH